MVVMLVRPYEVVMILRDGLIGPGVHASHGMERSHQQAINNTIELILAYLQA